MSRLNTEFDSRVLRTSTGFGGVTRPRYVVPDMPAEAFAIGPPLGNLVQTYCLVCRKPYGGTGEDVPAVLRGDPGLIVIHDACAPLLKPGDLPADAISLDRYKE